MSTRARDPDPDDPPSDSGRAHRHLLRHAPIENSAFGRICAAIAISPCLATLALAKCDIDAEYAEYLGHALAGHTELTSLDLSDNPITARGLASLAPALRKLVHLRELALRGSALGGEAAVEWIFPVCPALVTLDLRRNGIGEQQISHLAAALPQMGHLETLLLDSNPLGICGAAHLGKALRAMPQLVHLSLANTDIRENGTLEICLAFDVLANLNEIDLSNNGIGDAGACVVAAAWMHVDPRRIALRNNGIGEQGLRYLLLAKQGHPCTLDLRGNPLSKGGATAMFDAMRNGYCVGKTYRLGRSGIHARTRNGLRAAAERAGSGVCFGGRGSLCWDGNRRPRHSDIAPESSG